MQKPSSSPKQPSFVARYSCVGILLAFCSYWAKFSFIPVEETPMYKPINPRKDFMAPLSLTVGYLISLPLLKFAMDKFVTDLNYVKALLKETMIVYNLLQVLLNGWMVYYFLDGLLFRDHPFIFNIDSPVVAYATWIHYCDKYLEFFDTWFMVLRGRMDQVSFLHVYHHFSIAWAWWIGISHHPGGDSYFGALLNSWIHVMMYSYYGLALCGVKCPWKKYLTQAQLGQFLSVIVYTIYLFAFSESTSMSQKLCMGTQVFEMSSLFILFMFFYRKAYSKQKTMGKSPSSVDACQDAVKSISHSAEAVAKNTSKLVTAASKNLAPTQKSLS